MTKAALQTIIDLIAASEFEPNVLIGMINGHAKHAMSEPQSPSIPGFTIDALQKQAFQLPPSDQYRLAFFIAENVGYVMVREPDHPDCPHSSTICAWPNCNQPSGYDYCYEYCLDNVGRPTVTRPDRGGEK